MKKIKFLLAVALSAFTINANSQELSTIVEQFNKGQEAYKANNYVKAISEMETAYKEAKTVGAEAGEEVGVIISNCKNLIPDSYLKIGDSLANDKKYDEAIEFYTKSKNAAQKYGSLETFDESITRKIGTANLAKYMDANDFENALKIAQETNNKEVAEKLKTAIGGTKLKEAQGLLKIKQYSKAIELAKESINYNPDNASAHLLLGLASLQSKNTSQAIESLEKSIELSPTSQAYYYLAVAYQQSGNKDKACQNYKKVTDSKLKANATAQMKVVCK